MKKTAALLLCLVVTFAAGFLYAVDTSFRCGNDLISIGYSMYQIRNSCGAPDSEQVVGQKEVKEQRGQNKTDTTVYITEWTYNRDSGIYILTFEGSKLIKKEYKRLN
ncbi:MAG: DUF2845 domain-containing protein [Desulfobacterota bacterium]|jgi:hypothetical protein|nr:DUF2845 domain-containing protein [Thermodesulfobacteriota bacterium]